MNNSKSQIIIVERRQVEREYGFTGVEAIIDHDRHGRLLICDGFGGIDSLRGGAVRFEHGLVIKLHADDTLESLHDNASAIMDRALSGYDDSRPVLEWDGQKIAWLAQSLGL